MVITGEATTPELATVVDGNQSEKSNISDAGFSSRPIFQHQSFTKDATSLELEKYPAGHINSTVDGIKIMDEYSLVGKVLTIEEPRLFNYTGWYQVATGRTTYFQVLYKYNSKYDPN